MLLVVDAGNSNLVFGVFRGEKLACSFRLGAVRGRTADEYGVLVRSLLELRKVRPGEIEAVVVSSVIPWLDRDLEILSRRYFSVEPRFIRPEVQSLVPVHYQPASSVGADRIVNALAAFTLYGGPAVVVDFGTATTFDVVSRTGAFEGGVIAPGIATSLEALGQRTAKLPPIEIQKPDRVVGDSTPAAMQSGIFYGYVALVEGILQRIRDEFGSVSVVATGGMASAICPEVKGIDRVDENLTLHGLRIFHERDMKLPDRR